MIGTGKRDARTAPLAQATFGSPTCFEQPTRVLDGIEFASPGRSASLAASQSQKIGTASEWRAVLDLSDIP